MKKLAILVIALLAFTNITIAQTVPGTPVKKPESILKNSDSFNSYMYDNLKLSQNLTTYDENLGSISKEVFLEKLCTGDYLPLRLKSTDNTLHFQLYKLTDPATKQMGIAVKGWSGEFLAHYQMEDKPFPEFSFVDIKGNTYTTANTKGKTLVLKTWFIGCQRCEEEMPELNKLLAKYKNRPDIVFVSLALDSKEKLEAFLKRKRFDYPVVPDQNDFIIKGLKSNAFPTHFIVNKEGIIVSVVTDSEEVEYALEHKI
ncbi:TlpA family protein disulfide reductase [Inquilinus sp. KBS0705]|nr:TlpA family protein disulfide reductase [Inquilinus sp. KBS0705]